MSYTRPEGFTNRSRCRERLRTGEANRKGRPVRQMGGHAGRSAELWHGPCLISCRPRGQEPRGWAANATASDSPPTPEPPPIAEPPGSGPSDLPPVVGPGWDQPFPQHVRTPVPRGPSPPPARASSFSDGERQRHRERPKARLVAGGPCAPMTNRAFGLLCASVVNPWVNPYPERPGTARSSSCRSPGRCGRASRSTPSSCPARSATGSRATPRSGRTSAGGSSSAPCAAGG